MSKVVPAGNPKVIICDVDKMLTGTNSWYTLTSLLHGDVEKHYEIYNSFYKEEISFDEMKKKLFKLWEDGFGKKIHRDDLEDIFFKIVLKGEAFSTFGDLHEKGYRACLVSSFIDIFVKMSADRLRIDDWYANGVAIFDDDGYWVDFSYNKDESGLKLKQVEEYLKKNSIDANQVLVLGDGSSEIGLFEHFPGVAIDTEYDQLKRLSWKEIKFLPTILQVLQTLSE
jgi:HAD superfamily phosphoserine phosphatase-like hydrolase